MFSVSFSLYLLYTYYTSTFGQLKTNWICIIIIPPSPERAKLMKCENGTYLRGIFPLSNYIEPTLHGPHDTLNVKNIINRWFYERNCHCQICSSREEKKLFFVFKSSRELKVREMEFKKYRLYALPGTHILAPPEWSASSAQLDLCFIFVKRISKFQLPNLMTPPAIVGHSSADQKENIVTTA